MCFPQLIYKLLHEGGAFIVDNMQALFQASLLEVLIQLCDCAE